MEKFSISLQLNAFSGSKVLNLNLEGGEKRCVVIPIDEYMFQTANGGIWVEISAFPRQTNKFNQTHYLKRHLPKQVTDKMTKDEIFALPFLGSVKPLQQNQLPNQGYQQNYQPNYQPNNQTQYQPRPAQPQYVAATPQTNNSKQDDVNADDLPF